MSEPDPLSRALAWAAAQPEASIARALASKLTDATRRVQIESQVVDYDLESAARALIALHQAIEPPVRKVRKVVIRSTKGV